MVDAPDAPAFHLWVPHPPVPIVVDLTRFTSRTHGFYRQFTNRSITGEPLISARFCYDESVCEASPQPQRHAPASSSSTWSRPS